MEMLGAAASTTCAAESVDFIVAKGDALLAAIEDDIVADLAKVNIQVTTRFLEKADFNSNMTSGKFNLCFSETWGPPYDPHSYAASWKSPDEGHFAALKGMKAPVTQDVLTTKITNVLLEEDLQNRQQRWKYILKELHEQAIDLPFSGKRMPAVLRNRLSGYVSGEQQFDYPVHSIQVLSGSKTITVAPGAQTGLFSSVGRMDPHTYRPNEFWSNNWVYEGLVSYAAGGVIAPSLATSWTVKDLVSGGQEYTFQLRQGVKFHDGAGWTCAVAKLNFDHVLAKPLTTGDWHGWYDLVAQIQTWRCASSYTFVLTTKDKYYPLLQELTYIRPLRMLSPTMFQNGITTSPVTDNSCHKGWGSITGLGETITCGGIKGASGTGPFKYVKTETNGDALFNRNTDWWSTVPQVETMLVKKYASAAAVMAALLDGSLDAVLGAGVLEPSDLKTIQISHANTFNVFLGPAIMNRVIILNANKHPTDSLTLRKTIMHAVNKAAIIDKELSGFAKPVDALFPKNAPYCDVDLTPRWDYDIEKANLLRCAGDHDDHDDHDDHSDHASTVVTTHADESTGVNPGVVAGIVLACVIVILVASAALFFYGRQKGVMQQKLLQDSTPPPQNAASVDPSGGDGVGRAAEAETTSV
jgi:ABC-type transport system substrate-binding protein